MTPNQRTTPVGFVLALAGFFLQIALRAIMGLFQGLRWFWNRFPHLAGFLLCALLVFGSGTLYGGVKLVEDLYSKLTVTISSLTKAAESGHVFNGCDAECQGLITARRASVIGIEENEVDYVKAQLHREYAPSSVWNSTRIQTCLANFEMFERAQVYSMYPAELLAGKAYVEGIGCQFVNATNGDGGRGPMQITTPTTGHEDAVGAMLHEKRSWVRKAWKGQLDNPSWNYFTNVLVGAVMLSDYEEQFNSRGVGILAYNAGPGNAAKYLRAGGMKSCDVDVPHSCDGWTISNFRGAIPVETRSHAKPRIYLDRILAGAVMVDRAHRGLQVTDGSWIDQLTLADIPGVDPSKDSLR